MSRPAALSLEKLVEFAQTMKAMGASEFEFKGLRVKFDPTFHTAATTPDLTPQELSNAFQRFKEAAKDDDADLDWST